MHISAHVHVAAEPDTEIRCRHSSHQWNPAGYPVLIIGDLSVYPSVDQLVRLHEAIEGYLAVYGPSKTEHVA